ncbi:geranylgeranyl diphosphate synthase type I [Trueperella bonasi]|uniref:Geranylgeranyl diphosphate synthase type I n=1 Tax=Trueperella bonasi TaxID=312286 RepID=A0ABT9NI91_9ACTO|nr:polyprenyl synthetase family protein [Trueperella bonasi]MDP9807114.1 geranylgeranyl diphosphate synthase type I [Trueperella bonasi]
MQHLRSAVSQRITEALDTSGPFIDDPAALEIWTEFLAPARQLVKAGKRTRALLLAAGFEAFGGPGEPVHAGAALELYQLSALTHDDIIDESDTRRGVPATHRSFATTHRGVQLAGDPHRFGKKAGILLGDFLLSLGALEFSKAEHRDRASFDRASTLYHAMTAETAFGQYLDFRAELTELNNDQHSAINDSLLVLRHKSARYSVELPLLIGGALAGANDDDLALLTEVGRPLGIAFQLRDDELGIFGHPQSTGKPAGGDIAEGKRTVLLALARGMADSANRATIDDALGRDLADINVEEIQRIIEESGALEAHEEMIASYESRAHEAAAQLPRSPILLSVMASLEDRQH